MVDINLIPVAMRKNSKGSASSPGLNISAEIVIGVIAAVVFLLAAVHLSLGFIWWTGKGRLAGSNDQWQKVLPDKTQMDSMSKESGDLNKKLKLLTDMTARASVRWAPKFNAISDDIPKGLWMRKMTLDKAALTIEGSVVSKTQNEINNVGLFLSVLKQNNSFMQDFSSLEVNSIQRSKDNAVDVTDFTVMAKVK